MFPHIYNERFFFLPPPPLGFKLISQMRFEVAVFQGDTVSRGSVCILCLLLGSCHIKYRKAHILTNVFRVLTMNQYPQHFITFSFQSWFHFFYVFIEAEMFSLKPHEPKLSKYLIFSWCKTREFGRRLFQEPSHLHLAQANTNFHIVWINCWYKDTSTSGSEALNVLWRSSGWEEAVLRLIILRV